MTVVTPPHYIIGHIVVYIIFIHIERRCIKASSSVFSLLVIFTKLKDKI